MIDPLELRQQVRRVLSAASNDTRLSEPYVLAGLQRFFPTPVKTKEMMDALAWNEARGWAEKFFNPDEDRDEWKLTPRGRTKEGLV